MRTPCHSSSFVHTSNQDPVSNQAFVSLSDCILLCFEDLQTRETDPVLAFSDVKAMGWPAASGLTDYS